MPPIKQYVNLDSQPSDSALGNTRRLQIAPSSVPNVAAGDRVEWWIEPVVGNTDILYINPALRARLLLHETALATTGKFENTLHFPPAGGDKYVVKASKKGDRANAVQTGEFETWRKIYYTVFYMGAPTQNLFNSVKARFEQVFTDAFVEMENAAMVATLTQLTRMDVSYRVVSGGLSMDYMKGGANGIIDLKPDGTHPLPNTSAGTVSQPFHLALLIASDIYTVEKINRTELSTRALTGSTTFNFHLLQDPAKPRGFISRATVSWPGRLSLDVTDKFALVAPRMPSAVSWDLTNVPGLTAHVGATPSNHFKLEFTVVKENGLNGYSYKNFCVVRTAHGTTGMLSTVTHEVGHGLGQVVKAEKRWDSPGNALSDEPNPNWHTNEYGGQGPHCTTNASLANVTPRERQTDPSVATLTTGQYYKWSGGADLCTMYWRGDPHKVEPFCPHCQTRLKRFNLNATSMSSRQWNHYG